MGKKTRILTGIKPTGDLHLGNFVGAIRPCVEFSKNPAYEVIVLCADWHGLTTRGEIFDPGKKSLPLLATLLSLGYDVGENVLAVQSEFPQIQEIAWYLGCATGMGLLERAHAYKDATAMGAKPTVGLFYYPVLMASDIVTFDSDAVPVGKDQAQHLEYMSDMTKLFNNVIGKPIFKEAKPLIQGTTLLVGIDGEKKMSKSYDNHIPLFGPKKDIEKRIKSITTDSKGLDDPKDPETCAVFQILKSFGNKDAVEYMEGRLKQGKGYGYGHAKQDLWAEHQRVFGVHEKEYDSLIKDPEEISRRIAPGFEKARGYADAVRLRARESLGLLKLRRS